MLFKDYVELIKSDNGIFGRIKRRIYRTMLACMESIYDEINDKCNNNDNKLLEIKKRIDIIESDVELLKIRSDRFNKKLKTSTYMCNTDKNISPNTVNDVKINGTNLVRVGERQIERLVKRALLE